MDHLSFKPNDSVPFNLSSTGSALWAFYFINETFVLTTPPFFSLHYYE